MGYFSGLLLRKEASSSGGFTLIQSQEPSGPGEFDIGSLSSRTFVGTKFTAAESTTITKVSLELNANGSPTFNMRVGIYSDDAIEDDPNILIGTVSDYFDTSILDGTKTWYDFNNIVAEITLGTQYWVVSECQTIGDTSNKAQWFSTSSVHSSHGIVRSSTGSGTWTEYSATAAATYRLYKNV